MNLRHGDKVTDVSGALGQVQRSYFSNEQDDYNVFVRFENGREQWILEKRLTKTNLCQREGCYKTREFVTLCNEHYKRLLERSKWMGLDRKQLTELLKSLRSGKSKKTAPKRKKNEITIEQLNTVLGVSQ